MNGSDKRWSQRRDAIAHPRLFRRWVILWALLATSLWGAEPASIKLYDLRYTLDIDLDRRDQVHMAWDHCHAVAALQGLANRQGPALYVRFTDSQHRRRNIDDFWLARLSGPGQWLEGKKVERVATIVDLVEQFRSCLDGVVLYDPNVAATSNVASTVAGAERLLPIRYDPAEGSLYRTLVRGGPRLPVKCWLVHRDGTSLFTGQGDIPGLHRASTGSAKCDAYLWMKHKFLDAGKCNGAYGAYYLDQYWMTKPRNAVLNHHCLTNHDFFVAQKAFFFDLGIWGDELPVDDPSQPLGTDVETLKELLLSAYHHGGRDAMVHIGGFVPWAYKYTSHGTAGGRHAPVPTEWEYGKIISAYNGFMDADAISYGAMANASFFMHFPLRKEYPQHWVSRDELLARGYLNRDGEINFEGREFLIFYVGDYDCAAWLYQRMMDIWDDPARGQIPAANRHAERLLRFGRQRRRLLRTGYVAGAARHLFLAQWTGRVGATLQERLRSVGAEHHGIHHLCARTGVERGGLGLLCLVQQKRHCAVPGARHAAAQEYACPEIRP